jgi:predicted nucleic acid-binding protein
VIPVLVETNWVVDVCAPTHRRQPAALALLRRAGHRELEIHVPGIAFREAANVIRRKYQPTQAKAVQDFRRWAHLNGHIDEPLSSAANRLLKLYADMTSAEISSLDSRLDEVQAAVHAYALTDRMLEEALSLRARVHDLGPFDEAILAATVVKAAELQDRGPIFCTLDRDLSPVDKRGDPKSALRSIYDAVELTVRTDFNVPTR